MSLKSKAMRKGGRKVRKTLKNKKYKRGGSVENTSGAKPVQHNTLGNMMSGISSGFKGIGNMMGLRKPHEHPGAPTPTPPQPVPPQQGGRKVRKLKKHRKGGMFGIGEKPKTTYERAKEGMQHMGHNMHEGAKHMGHSMHEGAKHMYQNMTHHNQHAGKRKTKRNTKRNTKRKYSKAKKSRKN